MTTRTRYQTLDWSFQVNPDRLCELSRLMLSSFREVEWSCRLSDGSVVKPPTLQTLLDYDFSESHRVVSLAVEGSYAPNPTEIPSHILSRRSMVEFKKAGNVEYSLTMEAEQSFEYERKLRTVLERCRPSYAWLHDHRLARRVLIYVVLCGGGGALMEAAILGGVEQRWLRYGFTAQLLAGVWLLLENAAFPRSEFSFGGNENRVKRTVFWRIGLVGGLVSTIAGALLLSAL